MHRLLLAFYNQRIQPQTCCNHNHFFHHNNLESIANGFAMKTMATLNVVIKKEDNFQSLFDVFPP